MTRDRLKTQDSAQKTAAEILFEAYLKKAGFNSWAHEPEIGQQPKRPDYVLDWKGQQLVFEVKELHQKTPRPSGAVFFDPYRSVRSEINEAREQFKQLKKWCCTLVISNIDDWEAGLDPLRVFAAMLGDLGIEMDFDPVAGRILEGSEGAAFLDGGKMIRRRGSKPVNTTISAVAVLERYRVGSLIFLNELRRDLASRSKRLGRALTPDERAMVALRMCRRIRPAIGEVPRIRLIKNPVARIPFPQGFFEGLYDEQWVIRDKPIRIFAGKALVKRERAERLLHGPPA